jgi:hypothetical protein
MSDFDLYLGIDYSGAQTPASRFKYLQVSEGRSDGGRAGRARWMADMDARGALAGYFAPPLTGSGARDGGARGVDFGVM